VSVSNLAAAAHKPSLLIDHGKNDSVTEVQTLLPFDTNLLVAGEPVLPEATDRRRALKGAQGAHVLNDSIGSKEPLHRVEVAAVRSFTEAVPKLHQVGRRGLLGHRALKYRPQRDRLLAPCPIASQSPERAAQRRPSCGSTRRGGSWRCGRV